MASVQLSPKLEKLAQLIDKKLAIPGSSESLVPFLDERSEIYTGCNSREVARIKSNILARFEDISLPDSALPFVLEELESGYDPILIAAAAIAMRGHKTSSDIVPFLLNGLRNLNGHDDLVSFELCLTNNQKPRTTAQAEIVRTLRWLGNDASRYVFEIEELATKDWYGLAKETRHALKAIAENLENQKLESAHSCCGGIARIGRAVDRGQALADFEKTEFQDQDGNTAAFGERVNGEVTVLAFFYTRCENPRKCSLTISKLAKIQKAFSRLNCQAKILAVTYDPEYDLPHLIKRFGADRGLKFGESCSLLRATSGHEEFLDGLNVQVNFADSLVNHHALELMILDRNGNLSEVYSRIQWDPDEIVNRVLDLCKEPEKTHSGAMKNTGLASVFGSALIVAVMPKCPLCWATYLSFFGISTSQGFLSQRFVLGLALVFLSIFVFVVGRRCWLAKSIVPFAATLSGAIGLLIAMPLELHWTLRGMSLAFLMLGSFLSVRLPVLKSEQDRNQKWNQSLEPNSNIQHHRTLRA